MGARQIFETERRRRVVSLFLEMYSIIRKEVLL